jgi:rhodanese-related sulfurtransferase
MPQDLLIDVRSPGEFATGPLTSDIAPTINIEYTLIDQLPSIYAQQGITVAKNDNITLYCRSGRRSDIAMRRLRELGYSGVRDIGGLEEARRVLDREMVGRQLEGMVGEDDKVGEVERGDEKRGEGRERDFGALLAGLRECEG